MTELPCTLPAGRDRRLRSVALRALLWVGVAGMASGPAAAVPLRFDPYNHAVASYSVDAIYGREGDRDEDQGPQVILVEAGSASASAEAGGGFVLRTRASAGDPGPPNAGAGAQAISNYFEDFVVTSPGRTGLGRLELQFAITGSMTYDEPSDWHADRPYAAFTASSRSSLIAPPPETGVIPLDGPTSVSLTVPFLWGQVFSLTGWLQASAYTYGGGTSVADFSHTVRIGGFQFFDARGAVVDDVTVLSGSGVNPFVSSVPEPATLVLAAAGVIALALRRRTRA